MEAAKKSALGKSLTLTGRFFRKQLWIYPIVATLALIALGWYLQRTVERAIKDNLAADLQTVLDADVEALEVWLREQRRNVAMAASDPRTVGPALALLAEGRDPAATTFTLGASPKRGELAAALAPWLKTYDFTGWVLADPRQRIVSSSEDEVIGKEMPKQGYEYYAKALAGKSLVTRPIASLLQLPTRTGERRSGVPTMFAVAPLHGDDGKVAGLLALRMDPEATFTAILNVARGGKSAETYAFDAQGKFLSESRFEDQLKEIGLLPDQPDVMSTLALEMRNPGVDVTQGARPALRRAEQPLTKPAVEAAAGRAGVDVDGYLDYRGVPTVGAWKWLPEYGFGVTTEVDAREAFLPLTLLRRVFWGLFTLLALATLAVFGFTVWVDRLNVKARKAALEAKQLGQYALEEKIGEGGMGVVYRGRHALMQRPTAVKLLDPTRTTDAAVARFEREVRLSCQLNHPNTIAIYDYGRTPEGVFYYAMELLDGVNLEDLVERDGPQPASRAIHILKQICGSLQEAHSLGLIHRDIKPANIMLNYRGGEFDVVKLLDFGLVKAVDQQKQSTLTTAGTLTGTPMYLAPEAIQDPEHIDARADLYAVGAVGYFLLCGKPVFDGASVVELLMKHVQTPPQTPSSRLGTPLPKDLEDVIMSCLEKDATQRPATAADIIDRLEACQVPRWTRQDAEAWWRRSSHVFGPASTEPATKDNKLDATMAVPVRESL